MNSDIKRISLLLITISIFELGFSQKKYSIFIDHDKDLQLIDNKIFQGKDTLIFSYYDNGNLKSIGRYVIEENGKISNLKIGEWIENYSNGTLCSKGSYQISSFIDCGIAGLERMFYNYKIGYWEYHTQDSILIAKGEYQLINTRIDTRCKGGDKLIFMDITKDWIFSTFYQKTISDNTNILTTSLEYEDGFRIHFNLDKKHKKVIMTFDQKK